MRIFIALDIDDSIRERIRRYMGGVSAFAPDARWIRPEAMHVTLKFVGEKPSKEVEEIRQALSSVAGSAVELTFRGYGFFPTPKTARVFWIGIDAGPQLPALANSIDQATVRLGIPKEDHAFSPHLTLARGGRGSGSPTWNEGDGPTRAFQKLQQKLAALPTPEFGTMAAREFFLYESRLARGGSMYTKIARFELP
jgi:RNA 2',3'-cyclic 3'-phosphodiesterase